ncbi:hypothetical protein MK338_02695 [Streptococcus vestibularis]|jgi:hypothetical protein|nr:hypothetical protein [Streptococcus vestibularis]
MKQQDWIDFFQAVNGRNPSIQEMANLCLIYPPKLDFHWMDHLAYYFYQYE